jgi:hypothetical protein
MGFLVQKQMKKCHLMMMNDCGTCTHQLLQVNGYPHAPVVLSPRKKAQYIQAYEVRWAQTWSRYCGEENNLSLLGTETYFLSSSAQFCLHTNCGELFYIYHCLRISFGGATDQPMPSIQVFLAFYRFTPQQHKTILVLYFCTTFVDSVPRQWTWSTRVME